jgi:hypothetical protein
VVIALRDVFNALSYIAKTGSQSCFLPYDQRFASVDDGLSANAAVDAGALL